MKRGREQIAVILAGIAAILVFGTLGYMLLEGWNVVDSLYMTVITLTTVGYGEVHPMDPQGRVFTTILIILGVGLAAYSASIVGQFLLDGTLARIVRRRRMERYIAGLENHCIVCGYGRTGREVVAYLQMRGIPYLVVDRDPEVIELLSGLRVPCVLGNAHDNETLERARLDKARAVIGCAASDADNVFVALTARSMDSDIQIACRCEQRESEPKLRRAGADHVISPYSIAGRHLVASVYRPGVLEFIEKAASPGGATDFEELIVDRDAPAVGQTIGALGIAREYGVSILALRRQDGSVVTSPGADTVIEAMDSVLALGPLAQLNRLREVLDPSA